MFKKRPGLVSWSCWERIWALPLVQQETCMAVAQLSIALIRNCPQGIIVQKLHTSTTLGINIRLAIFSMFLISDSREQFFDLPIFASFIDFLVQEDSNPGHLDNDYPCKPFCHRRLHFEQKILPEIVTKNWRQKATLPIDPEQRFFIAGVTLQGRSFNFFPSHTKVTFPTLNSFFFSQRRRWRRRRRFRRFQRWRRFRRKCSETTDGHRQKFGAVPRQEWKSWTKTFLKQAGVGWGHFLRS